MKIVKELQSIVGPDYVLTAPVDLVAYSYDATFTSAQPQLVVLPGSTEEVSAVLKVANRERIPVTPRGAGSGLSGFLY
jgi:glycolate oxidase